MGSLKCREWEIDWANGEYSLQPVLSHIPARIDGDSAPMTTAHASLTHASSVLNADAYEDRLDTRRPQTTARDHAYTTMKNIVLRPKPLHMGLNAASTPVKHLPPLSCDSPSGPVVSPHVVPLVLTPRLLSLHRVPIHAWDTLTLHE